MLKNHQECSGSKEGEPTNGGGVQRLPKKKESKQNGQDDARFIDGNNFGNLSQLERFIEE